MGNLVVMKAVIITIKRGSDVSLDKKPRIIKRLQMISNTPVNEA